MTDNNNLSIYELARQVPNEAIKPITAGRLKGFSDINPMFRIKRLTEIFGPVGKGWYYEIVEERIVDGSDDQKVAFVKINLYVKHGDEWSKPIPGTGGSSFIAKEKSGLYTSDECFKMALTDALSVAMKALGVGADVYFEKDRSKYDDDSTSGNGNQSTNQKGSSENKNSNVKPLTDKQINRLYVIAAGAGIDKDKVDAQVKARFNKDAALLTKEEYDAVCSGYEGLKK